MGSKTEQARKRGVAQVQAQVRAGIRTFTPPSQVEVTVSIYDDMGEPIVAVVDDGVFVGSQNILVAWARMMMISVGTIIKERKFNRINKKLGSPQIIE